MGNLKEEVSEMKKEVKGLQEGSLAMSLLKDYKKQNKRLFVIWIITFIILVGAGCYILHLVSDIGSETTTQEVNNVDKINGNIVNKGVYGIH